MHCHRRRPAIDTETLTHLAQQITGREPPDPALVRRAIGGANGAEPWILDTADQVALVRDTSPHFAVFPEFQGASYLTRYNIATWCRASTW